MLNLIPLFDRRKMVEIDQIHVLLLLMSMRAFGSKINLAFKSYHHTKEVFPLIESLIETQTFYLCYYLPFSDQCM